MMARGLAVAFLAGIALLIGVVGTREPADSGAIAAALLGLGLASASVGAALCYYVPRRVRPSRRRARPLPALRRGGLIGLAVAGLVLLQARHDLQPISALAVLVPLVALEVLLAART